MGDIGINTRYLSSNRGIIKILQIVLGFVVSALLCGTWYRGCFGEGRVGYCTGLNFVILVINIVLFIINFINIVAWRLERIYSVVAAVLFLVASVLILWFMIETRAYNDASFIISAICIISEFFLFLWDVKILQGESPN